MPMFDHVNAACSAPLRPVDELVRFVSAEYDKNRATQLEVSVACSAQQSQESGRQTYPYHS